MLAGEGWIGAEGVRWLRRWLRRLRFRGSTIPFRRRPQRWGGLGPHACACVGFTRPEERTNQQLTIGGGVA